MTQVMIVDTSRQLVSGGRLLATERSLPTYVWMPHSGGAFPLVVFVHGYDVGPLTYARFCSTLASAGYIVAAPSFPLEDPSRGYGLDRADLPNEATDVAFVIDSLGHDALPDRIEDSKVAVVGHSDGADVALMLGYQKGTFDSSVLAVVADAPDPMTGPSIPSKRPLLLIQGNADSVVPYSASQSVFRQVEAPQYYLTLLGAGHLAPILGSSQWTPILDSTVAEFLDATIAKRGPGPDTLAAELAASSLVHLQTAP